MGKWIRKTPYVVTLLIVIIAAMIFLFKTKSTGFIPTEDEGRMFVTYELPEGTSTTRSIAMIKDIMTRVEALPEVDVVGGLAGLNIISFSNKSNVGTMFVKLKKWDDRKGSEHDVNAVIGKIIGSTKDIKEARVMPIAPLLFRDWGKRPDLLSSCSKPVLPTMLTSLRRWPINSCKR